MTDEDEGRKAARERMKREVRAIADEQFHDGPARRFKKAAPPFKHGPLPPCKIP